jgi:hypothetical protein
MGQKNVEHKHTIYFRNGTKVQIADMTTRKITEIEAPGMKQMVAAAQQDLAQMGKQFLKQIGGKETGKKKILGYECTVWRLPAVTQCIYKGVPLEIVSNIMGMERRETAIEAQFDIEIDPARYRLPDFPKEQIPVMATGDLSQAAAAFAQMTQSMPNAPKGSERSDPETLMLNQAKAMITQNRETILELERCVERSKTLEEVNRCEKRFSKRVGEPSEPLKAWNDSIKKEMLQPIREMLHVMECVEKAKNMQEIKTCTMQ